MSNRFTAGSGTYKCSECGKQTRETGYGEADLGYCAFCLRGYYLDNELSDGHITEEQYNVTLTALGKEYSREVMLIEIK